MRRYIDLVESLLVESVDFHPSIKTKNPNGKGDWITYPPGTTRRERVPCAYCKGTGKEAYEAQHGYDSACEWCNGEKTRLEWQYDFPNLNVSNANAHHIAEMLGLEPDFHGWIPPEQIPDVIRRLMRLKNGEVEKWTTPTTDERGPARVDKSGDIPRITTGPRMVNFGVGLAQAHHYVDRLFEILKWAQEHHTGVSWA